MAQPVAVDTWSAEDVRLSDVVKALADLRDQAEGRANAATTSVMTLVAVAPGDEQAYIATNALRVLGGHHPARIVILRPDPDQVASLGARTTLYSVAAPDGHCINFEEVVLGVRGQAALHLDSFVEAFTLSDLPVPVWYVSAIPPPADPLLSVATAVLLDSRDAAEVADLGVLLELVRRRTVIDLSWTRLAPWRELLAGLFEPPAQREWLGGIQRVDVWGKPGPCRLMGGWLAAQLALHPNQFNFADARHTRVTITCTRGEQTATFTVGRSDKDRTVTSQASLPSGSGPKHSVTLADDPLSGALASALTRLSPDASWERSLSAATGLAA